jgi:hypothetical protein
MENSYLEVETICFTVLILTEYFMTLSEINRIHVLTIACTAGSLLCYAICIIFLKNLVHVADLSFVSKYCRMTAFINQVIKDVDMAA